MNKIVNQFRSIDEVSGQYLSNRPGEKKVESSFGDILSQRIDAQEIRFSKHALNRLSERNIQLSAEQSNRLNAGVREAGLKGIRDSLVLVDSLAFVVNVPNRTVVTAMEQTEQNSNIFTNIDGAVIM